jgi:hypothetical protein
MQNKRPKILKLQKKNYKIYISVSRGGHEQIYICVNIICDIPEKRWHIIIIRPGDN